MSEFKAGARVKLKLKKYCRDAVYGSERFTKGSKGTVLYSDTTHTNVQWDNTAAQFGGQQNTWYVRNCYLKLESK